MTVTTYVLLCFTLYDCHELYASIQDVEIIMEEPQSRSLDFRYVEWTVGIRSLYPTLRSVQTSETSGCSLN